MKTLKPLKEVTCQHFFMKAALQLMH